MEKTERRKAVKEVKAKVDKLSPIATIRLLGYVEGLSAGTEMNKKKERS